MIVPAPAFAAASPSSENTGSWILAGLLRFRVVRTARRIASWECSGKFGQNVMTPSLETRGLTLGDLPTHGRSRGKGGEDGKESERLEGDHGEYV